MNRLIPFLALGCAGVAAAKPSAPNIVVILSDDLGYADTGLHGGEIRTPNLDRLAREGVELQRFYVCPVCSPTRVGLLTGMMPRRFGVTAALRPRDAGLPADIPTLPQTLKAAGYATALVGKWHAGSARPPNKAGFDRFYGFMGGQIDYLKHTGPGGREDWWRDTTPLSETGYSTRLFADEAVRILENRDKASPVFLQVAFNAPHLPVSAPPGYAERYPNLSATKAVYAGAVTAMDEEIGRILETLQKQGMADDTLVLFFSDNGAGGRAGGSNAPLRGGKDTLYEGGIRTLCTVRWTGKLKAGSTSAQPVAVHDLFPTILAAAGVTPPAGFKPDGLSQWESLRTGKTATREPIVIATADAAIVDGDWKLIKPADGPGALYRLDTPKGENEEVTAAHAAVAARLEKRLDEVLKKLPAVAAGERRPGGGKPRRN